MKVCSNFMRALAACASASLQHIAAAAIGAVDLSLLADVQIHARMPLSAIAAVAGHDRIFDLDDLRGRGQDGLGHGFSRGL